MSSPTRLIVVIAFDRNEDGDLIQAFEPRQFESEDRAKQEARLLSEKHDGVIAWSRSAEPDLGEYGEPIQLALYGDVPDMD